MSASHDQSRSRGHIAATMSIDHRCGESFRASVILPSRPRRWSVSLNRLPWLSASALTRLPPRGASSCQRLIWRSRPPFSLLMSCFRDGWLRMPHGIRLPLSDVVAASLLMLEIAGWLLRGRISCTVWGDVGAQAGNVIDPSRQNIDSDGHPGARSLSRRGRRSPLPATTLPPLAAQYLVRCSAIDSNIPWCFDFSSGPFPTGWAPIGK